jgi:fatty-acyl-CoA synthase
VVIDVCDSEYTDLGERLGAHEYEALLAAHDPLPRPEGPADEWDAIAVSCTSGTTGDPKGLDAYHRGAYLNAVGNVIGALREHGVDHYCAAPIVHNLIINADPALRDGIAQKVRAMVAGAAPPAAMIEGMSAIGFELTHVYGLTEVYAPTSVAVKRPS